MRGATGEVSQFKTFRVLFGTAEPALLALGVTGNLPAAQEHSTTVTP